MSDWYNILRENKISMQKINRIQFEYLMSLLESGENHGFQIHEIAPEKKDATQSIRNDLEDKGLIKDNQITDAGYSALEPYRAKRAVFVAAGFGSRLVPVTLNTPKPLVRVHGKRIIDGLIDACLAVGIEEIYIVRGYLAEQFDQLLYKYPMIKFIENPAYNETNNISSALCARYFFSNAYIFEADLLIRNPQLIKRYQYCSNFLGFFKDKSDDWCFTVKDGYIESQKIGGVNCYQEYGISYWDEESGRMLASDLKEAYEMPGGKELFWDKVPMEIFHDKYKVEVRECNEGDIVEIDTFRELKALDKSYDV